MEELNRDSIRGYELIARLGEGAYGVVYLAYQPQVQREVAIKIILPSYASQPDFIRRFEVEAQLIAQLEHLHIVPLYDFWRDPEGAYLVMRLMKGGNLKDQLVRGPLEPAAAVQLVDQIASALGAAHQQGVVHRDLKPANILLDEDGNAYLSDFGIAKKLVVDPHLTQTGAIVGTPAYITPEQVQSRAITPQTDIYSLGVVIYEMLIGGHPFPDTPTGELVARHLHDPLPLARNRRSELPSEVDEVIQRATAKDPAGRYQDVQMLAKAFRKALQPLVMVVPKVPERAVYNPYKGLRAFQQVDAEDFFGREALIGGLIGRLAITPTEGGGRFLAVVGPSGSGKSSVVKAGVVPALRKEALPGSECWFITEMVPGGHPLEELELALLRIAVQQPSSLLEQLEKDERGLLRVVRRVLPEDGELLLVIDQLEEVFTLMKDPAETAFFLRSLYEAVIDPHSPLRVIVTLRADFYDRPLTYPRFGKLVEQCTAIVLPLDSEELERVIQAPAERVGVVFEAGLVNTIIADVADQPGMLPLLQYTLTELFERRAGRMLTYECYQAIGGVLGALGERAEEIYCNQDEVSRNAIRQMFLRLITLGEGTEDTRRRVLRHELESLPVGVDDAELSPTDAAEEVLLEAKAINSRIIEAYGKVRLLSFDNDPVTRRPTVEVAHEALLYEWRRLREWLDESRADVRMQRVLANAASEWLQVERDPGFLLRGSRLEQFEAWVAGTNLLLTLEEQDFIDASLEERRARRAAEAERQAHEAVLERRSRNFLRGMVVVLTVAVVVAVSLSAYAINLSNDARRSAATATFAQGQAQLEAATAVVAQEQAQYQAQQAATMAAKESTARQQAEKTSRLATSRELVAFTLSELEQPSDVSYSLALLLAREAIFTTLTTDGYVTGPAEAALRQAIQTAPVQQLAIRGHTGPVNSAAWSPDGHFIVSAGKDTTVRIWDAESGNVVQILNGYGGEVNFASWSPDGSRIATASSDFSVRIWDSTTGLLLNQLQGHTSVVKSVNWSPDSTKVVSAGAEDSVRIWDVQTGEQLIEFYPRVGFGIVMLNINYAAFSPDGSRIATSGEGSAVTIGDSQTGLEQFRMDLKVGQIYTVKWNSDGSLLLTSHVSNLAFILDLETRSIVQRFNHNTAVIYASWRQDDRQVATVTSDGVIHIWDSQTGLELSQWQANTSPLKSVEWSPDGNQILTAGIDGVIRIWEIGSNTQRYSIEHVGPVTSTSWSPDGKFIATAQGINGVIWDARSGIEVGRLSKYSVLNSIAWNSQGDRILTSDFIGTAIIWDAKSGNEIHKLQSNTKMITDAVWSPDDRFVVTVGQDKMARIWSVESGQEIQTFQGHTQEVLSVAWRPNGDQILTTSADQTARIWDVQTGEELFQLLGHTGRVNSGDWSPDGRQVVTGGSDRTVRIWDAETGEQLNQLSGHSGGVQSVDWSPLGLQIVSAGEDRTVHIWDALSGEQVGQIEGHQGTIWSVAWSPDGNQILTGSNDKTTRIWPVGIEGLLKQAEALTLRDPPEFTVEERCVYLHECGEGEQ